jgi:hypothetical protein
MNYSNLHQGVPNKLQSSEVSTEPQNFLGPNYQSVLDFWVLLDTLTKQQWIQVIDRYNALEDSTKVDGGESAWYAAQTIAAAALRAAVDAVIPENAEPVGDEHDDAREDQRMRIRYKFLSIINELEETK